MTGSSFWWSRAIHRLGFHADKSPLHVHHASVLNVLIYRVGARSIEQCPRGDVGRDWFIFGRESNIAKYFGARSIAIAWVPNTIPANWRSHTECREKDMAGRKPRSSGRDWWPGLGPGAGGERGRHRLGAVGNLERSRPSTEGMRPTRPRMHCAESHQNSSKLYGHQSGSEGAHRALDAAEHGLSCGPAAAGPARGVCSPDSRCAARKPMQKGIVRGPHSSQTTTRGGG